MHKKHLMAPGPTPVPERARLVMAKQLIHHRGPEFKTVMEEVRQGLKWLFETEEEVLTLTCSGTGAFEAGIANFTARGDKLLAIGGGKFGERWAKVGRAYGLEVVDVEVEWGDFCSKDQLQEVLARHSDAAMVTFSASETSTGAYHPVEELVGVIREESNALVAVDGITAVGVHRLPMDAWEIDILVSGSQKALGIPPGLGFLAASARAWERVERSDHPRFYFDLRRELAGQQKNQTAFTPAISLVLALREVLQMMQSEGREALLERHERNAEATRAAVQALGLSVFPRRASQAVTAAVVPEDISARDIVTRMREDHGITIAGGQDDLKERVFRIGHIGFFEAADILLTIGALEQVLIALGMDVEAGSGLKAAQEVFARS